MRYRKTVTHLRAPPTSPATPASTTVLRLCVPPPTPARVRTHVDLFAIASLPEEATTDAQTQRIHEDPSCLEQSTVTTPHEQSVEGFRCATTQWRSFSNGKYALCMTATSATGRAEGGMRTQHQGGDADEPI